MDGVPKLAVALARRAPPWPLLRVLRPSWTSAVSQCGAKDQGVESRKLVMTGLGEGESCHFKEMLKN